jgi:hypothetical protein
VQRLLYYPLVNPPTPIVWQGLLYWDGIASIVPWDGDYFQPLLRELRDTPLYVALEADDLKLWDRARYDAMLRELQALIGQLPGADLEPELGPLGAGNRLYYGKLPTSLQGDLIAIGAAQPAGPAMRVNPRLLLAILAVTAEHLAQAYAEDATTYLPHTDRPIAHRMAVGPLAGAGGRRRCWQVEVGQVLPVPASDTPLEKVLRFRDDYQDERTRLRMALHRLCKELEGVGGPDEVAAAVRLEIADALRDMEAALRGRKLAWVKRGLWMLVGVAAAAAAPHAGAVPVVGEELTVAASVASGIAITLATNVTRSRVRGEFAYLHDLGRVFPEAAVAR